MSYDRAALALDLTRDEGRRRMPYYDSVGAVTIGVGWNLSAHGLPEDVIDLLLDRAIRHAEETLDAIQPRWRELDEPRQRVLLNMAFNLGPLRLVQFKAFWHWISEALELKHAECFNQAALEMLDSTWAKQVGARAQRLAAVMRGDEVRDRAAAYAREHDPFIDRGGGL